MNPVRFSPKTFDYDILHPNTRKSIDAWLATGPATHDGHPICGILQTLWVEPIDEVVEKAGDAEALLCSFEHVSVGTRTIYPFFRDRLGVTLVWSEELTDERMRGYRDPHFELSHDPIFLRLVNSDLPVLCRPDGGKIHLYHLAGGTLLVSTSNPKELPWQIFDAQEFHGALCSAILPRARSQHDKIRRAGHVSKMNDLLEACYCSASDNFENFLPDPVRLEA